MRPLELLLLLAVLLSFLALAIPTLRTARWGSALPYAAPLLAAAQAAIEGPRWQVVVAYLLAVALLIAHFSLRRSHASRNSRSQNVLRHVALAVGALTIIVAAALATCVPVFQLPEPTGPFGIGKVSYHWVDPNRPEPFTDDPSDHRELMVDIWYPTEKRRNADNAPYLTNADLRATTSLLRVPSFFLDHLKYVKTHVQPGAPIAGEGPRPTLVYSPGLGSHASFNTFKFEELVSQGYIVAAISHPYTMGDVAFPDGRHIRLDERMTEGNHHDPRTEAYAFFANTVYPLLGQDAVFALERLLEINAADPRGILTGRIDFERIGMFGSSLGGAATGEACRLERRFRACLALDSRMSAAVVQSTLEQPFMWIGAPAKQRAPDVASTVPAAHDSVRAVFDKLPNGGYLVFVANMAHPEIADYPFILPPPLGRRIGTVGPGEWRRRLTAINAFTLAFFDEQLKGESSTLLDDPTSEYPEVVLERRD